MKIKIFYSILYVGLKDEKSTFYSKIGVQIPKIAFFSISMLLGTLKTPILIDKMVLR